MRKLLNKSVGLVLAVFLFVSLLIVGIAKIDFSRLTVKAEYSRNYYKKEFDYSYKNEI